MKAIADYWLLTGLACAALAACSGKEAPPEPLRPVLTMVVGKQPVDAGAQYSGEIRSRTETLLSFRVGGKLVARNVDAGAVVVPGQVLARLDPADTAAQAMAAKSQSDLAAADLARYRELRARNFVSQAALDAKETAFKAARAQAEVYGNQSSYTTLKADQPGVISLVGAEVGQVVAPGQMVFRLARQDQPEVLIAIPETRVADLKPGSPATVKLWAGGDSAVYKGRLRELSPVADGVTRTYAARISILEPNARIRLGMTANVGFSQGAESMVLPLSAIFQQDGKSAVWVVNADETVGLRPVTVAAWREDGAYLGEGLTAGERIVVAGVHKLAPGEKIKLAGGRP